MMPDFYERGEARCENWAAENVSKNRFRCYCGDWCDMEDGESLSTDPYAIPVCPQCFKKAMDERYGPGWREKM